MATPLLGCGGGGDADAGPASNSPATVSIKGFEFGPAKLEVAAGTRVTWSNDDTAAHTATASDRSFDTGSIRKGQKSKAIVLDKPGTFAYICDFHPFMKATVVVR